MLLRAVSSAHSCTPCTHSSNVIVKSADGTTVIGLITDNDETAYRAEVSTLTKWCQENHLSLNIDKTKELVVDFRRQSREHTPITIDKTPVERVNSFKFLGCHITEDFTWSSHTDAVMKKTHQRLFFLRRLRKFGMSPSNPQNILHLHCGEHPDQLHHRLVWKQHRWQPQSSAKGCANCPPHCWRWASLPPGHLHQAVYKESPEDHQWLQPPVPQTVLSAALRKTSPQHPIPQLFPSGYQANEQSELIHPTAHSHFTICHALHFNSNTVQTGLHVHTAQIHQSICYHWIPSNAHPWHLRIQLMCVYICVHNVECVHTVYNVYW